MRLSLKVTQVRARGLFVVERRGCTHRSVTLEAYGLEHARRRLHEHGHLVERRKERGPVFPEELLELRIVSARRIAAVEEERPAPDELPRERPAQRIERRARISD